MHPPVCWVESGMEYTCKACAEGFLMQEAPIEPGWYAIQRERELKDMRKKLKTIRMGVCNWTVLPREWCAGCHAGYHDEVATPED